MAFEAAKRDQRIRIQRATMTRNRLQEDVPGWATIGTRSAQVAYGNFAERHQAAQEGATQVATFGVQWDPVTKALTAKDRILFEGFVWNIKAAAPATRNKGVWITALRSEEPAPAEDL